MADDGVAGIPEAAAAVLVLAPTVAGGNQPCAELCHRGERVVLLGYAGADAASLERRLAARVTGGDEGVGPGDDGGGTDADRPAPPVHELGVGRDVEPGDLTGQGIAIADAVGPGTVVCYDSVTALLQYADTRRVVRYLQSLIERCLRESASIHLHLDPTTTDERTVAAVAMLVDAVVREGTATVRPGLTEKD